MRNPHFGRIVDGGYEDKIPSFGNLL